MAESTRISQGEEEYEEIWEAWIENGSPSIFDYIRDSDYGGSIIRVLDRAETYPDFYRAASLPDAEWDEDSDTVQWKGRWPALNEDYEQVRIDIQTDDPTRPAIRRIKFTECPNELS